MIAEMDFQSLVCFAKLQEHLCLDKLWPQLFMPHNINMIFNIINFHSSKLPYYCHMANSLFFSSGDKVDFSVGRM